ncbi:bifunctional protein RfaE, domain I [Sulfurihydrogenibium azorense Az-Fu1]|jgi:rfaE bifunctional protein kinase chain/domain|uniref:Bifunctional protein RfaE, domain I n=1 Tax=Sulfurihydrogenibium azorense (strain DSM 15241 / OCM 825 / Az-Fu1) TaxID=204536 RepID=C1DTJ8_SULAA|nr:D-glycero-beta-D-manno-heptose-7-phosphate kinase [Sulfurihydrogenibium azorense]ACN99770.1 bifunctional protein RfaE, domain I [Sulfurihydrogenibium azorense Az-Fu1]
MISVQRAEELISKFSNIKIAVVGDVILDKYLWGEVERISPEAPVPIVDVKRETLSLGGASNVANNIVALDATAYMVGIVGDDENGRLIEKLIKEKGIHSVLIKDSSRPTIEKTRVIAVSQQLLRIDREERKPLDREIEEKLLESLKSIESKVDGFIVSDYGKGVVTEKIMSYIKSTNKPVFVDPKPSNFHLYEEITIMTPNKKEAYESIKADKSESIEEVGKRIMESLRINQLLITLGSEGMVLFERGKVLKIPAKARKVFDVTGAGDTVISVLALSRLASGSWEESATISNYAAGYVVGEIGTATVNRKILLETIESQRD